ncbi:hypothetical protein FJTKL_07099 [Diaporthe vaccinii]|uniref:Uncharacterized protein n=1 Tax=Diaporthe vaccinii TaxID=105482 RepID=A0ABR4EV60_9PEZI
MGPRLVPICRCQAVLGARRTPEAAPGWMFLGLVLAGRRNRTLDHLLILRLKPVGYLSHRTARLYKFRIVEDTHNTDCTSNTTVSLLDLTWPEPYFALFQAALSS